jgi:hypothetical protein
MKNSVLYCTTGIHFITMPKVKLSKSHNLKQIVVEFGYDIFSTDSDIYTVRCDTKIVAEKRFTIQHTGCNKHI